MNIFKKFVLFLNGFRKFIVINTLIIVGIVFRVTDYISGSEFVDLLRYTAVAYFAGNGVEHMAKATIEWIKGKDKKEDK